MAEDESYLNGLAIGHYVVGGIMALFARFPLIHAFISASCSSMCFSRRAMRD
jgi:hypothetical protein